MIGIKRKAILKILEKNTETMQALSPRKKHGFFVRYSYYTQILKNARIICTYNRNNF